MTRDECLLAVSAAFGNTKVYSLVDTWQVIIETSPRREINMMPALVMRNIDGNGMQPDELKSYLQGIGESGWAKKHDGSFSLLLH
jgi:hypothetical protein